MHYLSLEKTSVEERSCSIQGQVDRLSDSSHFLPMNYINHWHAACTQSATCFSLMDYSGVNPAQYVVSAGGLREAELEVGELSLSLVLS